MIYPEAMRSYPPGFYEKYILGNFLGEIGFDLYGIGEKIISKRITVNLNIDGLIDIKTLRNSFKEAIDFIDKPGSTRYDDVIWYKLDILDQAIHEYMGIGVFKLENDYLKFIKYYLDVERAGQSGDTIIVLFDKDFNWAVNFTLCQDYKYLSVDVFDSGSRQLKIIDHST